MTLRLYGQRQFTLTIPIATMRAEYPGWEPHLSPADVADIAGDSGATVDIVFTDEEPTPAAN